MPNLRTDATALATIAGSALLGGMITLGAMRVHHLNQTQVYGPTWTSSHDVGPRIEIHSGDVSRAIIVRELHRERRELRTERKERRRHRHRHLDGERHLDLEGTAIQEQMERAANGAIRFEASDMSLRMERLRARAEGQRARMERQRERMERRRRR